MAEMNVIWATDGSPGAESALRYLKGPLNGSGVTVFVASVAPAPLLAEERPDPARLLWGLIPGYRKRVSAAVAELIVQQVGRLGRVRSRVESIVRLGSPAAELIRLADEQGAAVVLSGSHGHSALGELLLGSVSHQLALHAPCSVLLARGRGRPARVLVAYDGSRDADAAVELLARWPSKRGLAVTLLHVLEPPTLDKLPEGDWERAEAVEELRKSRRRAATRALGRAARRLKEAGWATVRTRVREGNPAAVILAQARELDSDLVCVGAGGERGEGVRTVAGEISERVLSHAECDVLVARTGASE